MTDNSHSHSAVPAWGQMLINVLYVLCAIIGLLVGVYGAFIFVVGVIISSGFYFFGLACGLPLIIVSVAYLALVRSLLFMSRFRKVRYKPLARLLVLCGSVDMILLGYYVFSSLRGI